VTSRATIMKMALLSAGLTAAGLLAGCRGQPSTDPPIHLVGDMDWQPKYRPEAESAFFSDQRTMRPIVEGTVSQTGFHDDDPVYTGNDENGKPLAIVPAAMTDKVIDRGQERFNIYCTPCHDKSGGGRGIVVQRGFPQPIDLIGDRVRGLADGEIFHVISDGVRNMPAYRFQVPVEDRWAIVSWVRVLQRSQHAGVADVPPEKVDRIEPEGTTR
jgi:mono/diheme cytochrome c family protein